MDIAMGQVMNAIREKGIERNTLVIYLNDNGGPAAGSNGPYRGVKSHYHEGGIRVPAAMRWPGSIPADTVTDEMLHAVDLFPTLCRLAGADASKGLPLDGKDCWATVASKAPTPHEEIVYSLQVIRSGDWKFIEEGASYYEWKSQPLQLYNIREDPYEEHNRAADHPELVSKLRARLAHHRRFGREEEREERIPNYPPVVYGEEENRQYGESLRDRVRELKLTEQPERARQKQ
jgi:arylsulfatase A-like enzyme